MGKIKAIVRQNFSGGWSIGKKVGIKNSQAFTQGFNFRTSPSQMSVVPALQREDNGIVKDLIQEEVMSNDGQIYAIGSLGAFYKRTTSGVWSKEADIGIGTFGLDYRKDTDSIYAPTMKNVSLYSNVSGASGSPAMYMNFYTSSYSTLDNSSTVGFNVAAYQAPGNLSYIPPTSIIENSSNLRYFQSDIEPLQKISIFINTKGTGDWTLTLHDGNNNALGTATVTNANLVNNTWNDFTFSSAPSGQVRIYVAPNARTYHVHVTSTVADGSLSTSLANDISQCALEVWANRLVQPNNGMHPMDRFLQYEIIGNGNYVSVWEPLTVGQPPASDTSNPADMGAWNLEWLRHRLVFPMEYEVCGLAHTNEYEVIALQQTTTSNTATPQSGIIAFWDGASPTYNYYLTIPEGSPQAIQTYENVVYYYAGGSWYSLTSPTTLPVKIWKLPHSDTEFSGSNSQINVYPHASTVRHGILLMAYPSQTTNTGIQFGVYSWGSVDKNFPESFGYDNVISTGSQNYSVSNNLQIGMVKSFGDVLHVSWQDTTSGGFGVDVITNSSPPAATAIFQDLIFDNGYVGKFKMAGYVEAYFSLPSGANIQLAYSLDSGAFVLDPNIYTSTNLWQGVPNYARFDVDSSSQARFHEFQGQATVTSDNTVTQPPIVRMFSTVFDDLSDEPLL